MRFCFVFRPNRICGLLIVSNVVSVQILDFSKRVSRSYRRDAFIHSVRCSSSSEFDNVSFKLGINSILKLFSVVLILIYLLFCYSSEQCSCEGEECLSDSLSWWSREENESRLDFKL